jgi:hypothetical protein
MKSAKEWAAECVSSAMTEEFRSGRSWRIVFEHGEDMIIMDETHDASTAESCLAEQRAIIERIAERVQADTAESIAAFIEAQIAVLGEEHRAAFVALAKCIRYGEHGR